MAEHLSGQSRDELFSDLGNLIIGYNYWFQTPPTPDTTTLHLTTTTPKKKLNMANTKHNFILHLSTTT